MIIVYLVVIGLCLGSFINALVWRIHEQSKSKKAAVDKSLSMTRGRSMCSNCKHPLALKDLIPVVSWVSLRGKCRYCKKPIPDTPLPELIMPLLLVLSYAYWPYEFGYLGIMQFILWAVILTGLVALAIYDLRWMLLPDRMVFPLAYVAGAFAVLGIISKGDVTGLIQLVLSVGVASGIFYALFLLSDGRWIGGGDVKLGLVLGLVLGTAMNSFMMIFFASILGSLVALPMMLFGKAGRETKLPFGPFLIAATIIVFIFGASIDSYVKSHILYL